VSVDLVPVVKKTIALHPIMDRYVRLTEKTLREKGYDPTYSTAVNFMLLYIIFDLQYRKVQPKVAKMLSDFLNDRESVNQISRKDRGKHPDWLKKASKKIELDRIKLNLGVLSAEWRVK
jgi:hypothetical protein